MIQPKSIKSKLKMWVIIIFVLTGTAGWAGIWGLFYFQNGGHSQDIWMLQAILFVLVLACQGFSAWAGWKVSKSLTSELNTLKEFAEQISMGDLKTEVKVDTTDSEIVAVGEALDRLRVSLAKAMERLSRRTGTPAPAAVETPAE